MVLLSSLSLQLLPQPWASADHLYLTVRSPGGLPCRHTRTAKGLIGGHRLIIPLISSPVVTVHLFRGFIIRTVFHSFVSGNHSICLTFIVVLSLLHSLRGTRCFVTNRDNVVERVKLLKCFYSHRKHVFKSLNVLMLHAQNVPVNVNEIPHSLTFLIDILTLSNYDTDLLLTPTLSWIYSPLWNSTYTRIHV